MNIRCPQCQSVFRVDPEKVPAGGVRARCARCSAIFALHRNGIAAEPRPEPTSAAPAAQAEVAAPRATPAAQSPHAVPIPERAQPLQTSRSHSPQVRPALTPPMPQAPPPAPGTPALAASPGTPAAPRPRPTFGKQDPHTRANRIARALVSDIVAYNRERRDQTLVEGTLKLEFRDEIRKSWEEYVEQVGLDMARTTPYFRDALNAILANAQPIF